MNIYDSKIEEMKRLMEYGLKNEEAPSYNKTVVEYHAVGADGKTYGIIRENNKFYIKCAPKKDTEVLAEDYDYIGGFMNRKSNEFSSYAKASKELEMKLMSLNEAYSSKNEIQQEYNKPASSEWQINETKEMKSEIQRQREIMKNASAILNESDVFAKREVPEAPATNPSSEKTNAPFTEKSKAELDKDFKKTSSNHKTAGSPFKDEKKVTNSDMEDDKNKKGGDDVDSPNTEKPKYAPSNSVTTQHPSGGKVVKVNEGRKKVKVSESQVLTWNDCQDYMDKSHGTKIGSSEPFCDNACIKEDGSMHDESDNINKPTPGNGKIGDSAPFEKKVNEDSEDYTNYAGMPDEDDDTDVPFPEVEDYSNSDLDFENDYNEWLDDENGEDMPNDEENIEFYNDDIDPSYGFDNPYQESKNRRGKKVNEETTVLNDFGKHPAYQKVVMTTPPNVEVAKDGCKDWNDDSVKGNEPYGKKIGSSDPFNEIVKIITDSVMSKLESAQKKK